MKKAIKKAWVKTLRSGKFKQGTGKLKRTVYDYDTRTGENKVDHVQYCCLGVLGEILPKFGIKTKFNKDETLYYGKGWNESMLPVNLAHKLGLDEEIDNKSDVTFQEFLADMNDSPRSFKQIANWIEKHVPEE